MEIDSLKTQLGNLLALHRDDDANEDDIVFATVDFITKAHNVGQMLLLEGRFQELQRCLHLCQAAFADHTATTAGTTSVSDPSGSQGAPSTRVHPLSPEQGEGRGRAAVVDKHSRGDNTDSTTTVTGEGAAGSSLQSTTAAHASTSCLVHSTEDQRVFASLQSRTAQLQRQLESAMRARRGRDTDYYMQRLGLREAAVQHEGRQDAVKAHGHPEATPAAPTLRADLRDSTTFAADAAALFSGTYDAVYASDARAVQVGAVSAAPLPPPRAGRQHSAQTLPQPPRPLADRPALPAAAAAAAKRNTVPVATATPACSAVSQPPLTTTSTALASPPVLLSQTSVAAAALAASPPPPPPERGHAFSTGAHVGRGVGQSELPPLVTSGRLFYASHHHPTSVQRTVFASSARQPGTHAQPRHRASQRLPSLARENEEKEEEEDDFGLRAIEAVFGTQSGESQVPLHLHPVPADVRLWSSSSSMSLSTPTALDSDRRSSAFRFSDADSMQVAQAASPRQLPQLDCEGSANAPLVSSLAPPAEDDDEDNDDESGGGGSAYAEQRRGVAAARRLRSSASATDSVKDRDGEGGEGVEAGGNATQQSDRRNSSGTGGFARSASALRFVMKTSMLSSTLHSVPSLARRGTAMDSEKDLAVGHHLVPQRQRSTAEGGDSLTTYGALAAAANASATPPAAAPQQASPSWLELTEAGRHPHDVKAMSATSQLTFTVSASRTLASMAQSSSTGATGYTAAVGAYESQSSYGTIAVSPSPPASAAATDAARVIEAARQTTQYVHSSLRAHTRRSEQALQRCDALALSRMPYQARQAAMARGAAATASATLSGSEGNGSSPLASHSSSPASTTAVTVAATAAVGCDQLSSGQPSTSSGSTATSRQPSPTHTRGVSQEWTPLTQVLGSSSASHYTAPSPPTSPRHGAAVNPTSSSEAPSPLPLHLHTLTPQAEEQLRAIREAFEQQSSLAAQEARGMEARWVEQHQQLQAQASAPPLENVAEWRRRRRRCTAHPPPSRHAHTHAREQCGRRRRHGQSRRRARLAAAPASAPRGEGGGRAALAASPSADSRSPSVTSAGPSCGSRQHSDLPDSAPPAGTVREDDGETGLKGAVEGGHRSLLSLPDTHPLDLQGIPGGSMPPAPSSGPPALMTAVVRSAPPPPRRQSGSTAASEASAASTSRSAASHGAVDGPADYPLDFQRYSNSTYCNNGSITMSSENTDISCGGGGGGGDASGSWRQQSVSAYPYTPAVKEYAENSDSGETAAMMERDGGILIPLNSASEKGWRVGGGAAVTAAAEKAEGEEREEFAYHPAVHAIVRGRQCQRDDASAGLSGSLSSETVEDTVEAWQHTLAAVAAAHDAVAAASPPPTLTNRRPSTVRGSDHRGSMSTCAFAASHSQWPGSQARSSYTDWAHSRTLPRGSVPFTLPSPTSTTTTAAAAAAAVVEPMLPPPAMDPLPRSRHGIHSAGAAVRQRHTRDLLSSAIREASQRVREETLVHPAWRTPQPPAHQQQQQRHNASQPYRSDGPSSRAVVSTVVPVPASANVAAVTAAQGLRRSLQAAHSATAELRSVTDWTALPLWQLGRCLPLCLRVVRLQRWWRQLLAVRLLRRRQRRVVAHLAAQQQRDSAAGVLQRAVRLYWARQRLRVRRDACTAAIQLRVAQENQPGSLVRWAPHGGGESPYAAVLALNGSATSSRNSHGGVVAYHSVNRRQPSTSLAVSSRLSQRGSLVDHACGPLAQGSGATPILSGETPPLGTPTGPLAVSRMLSGGMGDSLSDWSMLAEHGKDPWAELNSSANSNVLARSQRGVTVAARQARSPQQQALLSPVTVEVGAAPTNLNAVAVVKSSGGQRGVTAVAVPRGLHGADTPVTRPLSLSSATAVEGGSIVSSSPMFMALPSTTATGRGLSLSVSGRLGSTQDLTRTPSTHTNHFPANQRRRTARSNNAASNVSGTSVSLSSDAAARRIQRWYRRRSAAEADALQREVAVLAAAVTHRAPLDSIRTVLQTRPPLPESNAAEAEAADMRALLARCTGDVYQAFLAHAALARRGGDYMTPLEHVSLQALQQTQREREDAAKQRRLLLERQTRMRQQRLQEQQRQRIASAKLLQRVGRGLRWRQWLRDRQLRAAHHREALSMDAMAQTDARGTRAVGAALTVAPAEQRGLLPAEEQHLALVGGARVAAHVMGRLRTTHPEWFSRGVDTGSAAYVAEHGTAEQRSAVVTLQRFVAAFASRAAAFALYQHACARSIQLAWRLHQQRRRLRRRLRRVRAVVSDLD